MDGCPSGYQVVAEGWSIGVTGPRQYLAAGEMGVGNWPSPGETETPYVHGSSPRRRRGWCSLSNGLIFHLFPSPGSAYGHTVEPASRHGKSGLISPGASEALAFPAGLAPVMSKTWPLPAHSLVFLRTRDLG